MATTRGVSIEASWEGDVRGRWFLQPRDRLLVGPTAACDIVVSERVIARPRELVRLDADGLMFALDLPSGSLLREPQDTSRDAYRRPAWQRIESGPRHFARDTAIDLRIGPWRLSLRAAEVEPLPRRRSSWACLPLHALVASMLLHALVAGLALSTPPPPTRLSMPEPDESIYLPATWTRSAGIRSSEGGYLPAPVLPRKLPHVSLSYTVSSPPGLDEQGKAITSLLQRPDFQTCLRAHCRWPARASAAFDLVVHPGGRLELSASTGCAQRAEPCLNSQLGQITLPSVQLRFHHVRLLRQLSE